MTTYKVGIGNGLSLGSLSEITPQPRSTGVQRTRRSYAADSSIYQEAPFVLLEWVVLNDDNEYGTLLNQFGLVVGLTSPVTVLVRNEFWAFTLYSGTAVQPEMGATANWDNFFPRNIQILVRDLVAI